MGNLVSRMLEVDPGIGEGEAKGDDEYEREYTSHAKGMERIRNQSPWILGSLAFWLLARPVSQSLTLKMIPDAEPRAGLYGLSILNAAVLGGGGLAKLLLHKRNDTRYSIEMVSILLGYLLHDTYATRSDWMQYPADLLHHGLGISLAVADIYLGAVLKALPGLFTVELSTIFLSSMWLIRRAGRQAMPIYPVTMGLFAATFFATRVVYMPFVIYQLRAKDRREWKRLGFARYCLYTLQLLQWYWGVKIARMAQKTLLPASS